MEISDLLQLAYECGFTYAGELNTSALELKEEVRSMCSADRCQSYGKSWACPPAAGTLPEIRERILPYKKGILVQTSGIMEDDFDVDTIMRLMEEHKEHFEALVDRLAETGEAFYPMSAGTCTRCGTCAYPKPCRFPDKCIPSMEACGILVSDICERSGLPYYYGPKTMTYTSCVLTGKIQEN